jgi:SAM-dependent methyltransferase
MEKFINAVKFVYSNGINRFVKEYYYKLTDTFYENYFNVNTRDIVSLKDLGVDDCNSLEYCPIHYRHTMNALSMIPLSINERTLLDYGCGKGRVLTIAAAQPYKKIIGVEISELITMATSNIENMKHKKAHDVVLQQCDAQEFCVPDDVNVIYFFNPFRGGILEKVVENIRSSHQETPRKMWIAFVNNRQFDKIVLQQGWLTKTHQSEFYPHYTFGLYETH